MCVFYDTFPEHVLWYFSMYTTHAVNITGGCLNIIDAQVYWWPACPVGYYRLVARALKESRLEMVYDLMVHWVVIFGHHGYTTCLRASGKDVFMFVVFNSYSISDIKFFTWILSHTYTHMHTHHLLDRNHHQALLWGCNKRPVDYRSPRLLLIQPCIWIMNTEGCEYKEYADCRESSWENDSRLCWFTLRKMVEILGWLLVLCLIVCSNIPNIPNIPICLMYAPPCQSKFLVCANIHGE